MAYLEDIYPKTMKGRGHMYYRCCKGQHEICLPCAMITQRGEEEVMMYPGEVIYCSVCGDRVRATVTEYPEVRVTQSPVLDKVGVAVKFEGCRLTQTSTLARMGIYVDMERR